MLAKFNLEKLRENVIKESRCQPNTAFNFLLYYHQELGVKRELPGLLKKFRICTRRRDSTQMMKK